MWRLAVDRPGGAPGPSGNAMVHDGGASEDTRTRHARLRHVALAGSETFSLTLEG